MAFQNRGSPDTGDSEDHSIGTAEKETDPEVLPALAAQESTAAPYKFPVTTYISLHSYNLQTTENVFAPSSAITESARDCCTRLPAHPLET